MSFFLVVLSSRSGNIIGMAFMHLPQSFHIERHILTRDPLIKVPGTFETLLIRPSQELSVVSTIHAKSNVFAFECSFCLTNAGISVCQNLVLTQAGR